MPATNPDDGPRLIREYFSFDRDLDNLFVEAGRQAHVIWRLDGSFGGLRAVSTEIVNPPGGGTEGIWAEPLRLADYVHLHVWDAGGGLTAVERNARRHSRRVGWTDIDYEFGSHPYLKVRKSVWVPLQQPAAVVEATLTNRSDRQQSLRLFVEFRSHLSIGWPLREGGRNTAAYDPALPGIVAHDEGHPQWTALCASSLSPEAWHLGDFAPHLIGAGGLAGRAGGRTEPGPGCSCLQFDVTLPPDGLTSLAVVVCGSPHSEDEARATCREVHARLAELREEKRRHYADLFARTAVLDSPSYVFNKAFLWAKLGTEDFKHHDPRLGFLFFAGFPAYNFYFASDTMLILRGSLSFGDFEDARRMLRTIVRYQATGPGRDTLPGEIWHEMSTTGDRISPNFAGFLFPGVIRAFYEWSADRSFLEEMYPHVRALVEWGYRMDTNGDGLLENGPEGEMADSASEDRNVERSHYTVQVQWLDALREAAHLAGADGRRRQRRPMGRDRRAAPGPRQPALLERVETPLRGDHPSRRRPRHLREGSRQPRPRHGGRGQGRGHRAPLAGRGGVPGGPRSLHGPPGVRGGLQHAPGVHVLVRDGTGPARPPAVPGPPVRSRLPGARTDRRLPLPLDDSRDVARGLGGRRAVGAAGQGLLPPGVDRKSRLHPPGGERDARYQARRSPARPRVRTAPPPALAEPAAEAHAAGRRVVRRRLRAGRRLATALRAERRQQAPRRRAGIRAAFRRPAQGASRRWAGDRPVRGRDRADAVRCTRQGDGHRSTGRRSGSRASLGTRGGVARVRREERDRRRRRCGRHRGRSAAAGPRVPSAPSPRRGVRRRGVDRQSFAPARARRDRVRDRRGRGAGRELPQDARPGSRRRTPRAVRSRGVP